MSTVSPPRVGKRALRADLARADRLREVAACANFLKRGTEAYRRQDSVYAPTAAGLYQALSEELRRMAKEAKGA